MNINFFPYPLLIGLLTLFIFLSFLLKQRRNSIYLLCFCLCFCYLLLVLDITFFPIQAPQNWPGNVTSQNAQWILSHVNLIPFSFGNLFTANASTIFLQLAGNILVTIPFGFGLALLARISVRRALWLALFAGIALEGTQLVIELLGLIAAYGHSIDINDMLLNTAGVLVGYSIASLFTRMKPEWIQQIHRIKK